MPRDAQSNELIQGLWKKGHISGVEEKPLSDRKAPPPTPPYQGSKPTEEGGFARRCVSRQWLMQTLVPHSRLTPVKGGRGGAPLTKAFSTTPPSRKRPAFPRNCRHSRNSGLRYRARDAGKGFAPADQRAGRGGFLMGWSESEAANPSEKSSTAPSSVAFDTRSSLAFDLLRGAFSRRGVALMNSRMTTIMKVMIFPIKSDKFTMLFDKFLKNTVLVNHCNHTGYHSNLSALH